jgi:hypothetical protein
MILVDNILLSPFKGLAWICREIQKAADQECVNERDQLSDQLSKAYVLLETGQLTEAEFAKLECQILDRLDALKDMGQDEASEPEVR